MMLMRMSGMGIMVMDQRLLFQEILMVDHRMHENVQPFFFLALTGITGIPSISGRR